MDTLKDLIIINPLSNYGKALQKIEETLKKSGESVRRAYEKADKIILKPDDRISDYSFGQKLIFYDRVFICAGDGTVNSLVTQIVKQGLDKKISVGVIPGGFGNAVARMHGVESIADGLKLLLPSTAFTRTDLFATNLEDCPYITFTAGVGLESEIIKTRHENKHLNVFSYLIGGVLAFIRSRRRSFKLKIDDKTKMTVMASGIMIANGPWYGFLKVAPDAKSDDGLMDVRIYSQHVDFLLNLQPKSFNYYPTDTLSLMDIRAKKIRIKGGKTAQIDGDPYELTKPLEITVLQKKVRYLTLLEVVPEVKKDKKKKKLKGVKR
jgi:diacylglycerol kinase family enzyme